MGVGEREAPVGVNDRSCQRLGQFPERRECLWVPPDFASDDHGPRGVDQEIHGLSERLGIGRGSRRRTVQARLRDQQRRAEALLLQVSVEADVYGSFGLRGGNAIGPQQRFGNRLEAIRLVIIFHEVAHQVPLHQRSMDPIRRAPQGGILRSTAPRFSIGVRSHQALKIAMEACSSPTTLCKPVAMGSPARV